MSNQDDQGDQTDMPGRFVLADPEGLNRRSIVLEFETDASVLAQFHFVRLMRVRQTCSMDLCMNMQIEEVEARLSLVEAAWTQFNTSYMAVLVPHNAEIVITPEIQAELYGKYDRAETAYLSVKTSLKTAQDVIIGRRSGIADQTETDQEPELMHYEQSQHSNEESWAEQTEKEIAEMNRESGRSEPQRSDSQNSMRSAESERMRAPGSSASFRPVDYRLVRRGSTTMLQIGALTIEPFASNHLKWPNFRSKFEEMVHQSELKMVEKANLLVQLMERDSEPYGILEGYTHTADNYQKMWQRLIETYEDRDGITAALVYEFEDLPEMRTLNREAIMKVINVTNKLLLQMPRHGVSVQDWEVWIIPILLRKVDWATQRAWIKAKAD